VHKKINTFNNTVLAGIQLRVDTLIAIPRLAITKLTDFSFYGFISIPGNVTH